jgi:uncharacterized membrane protein
MVALGVTMIPVFIGREACIANGGGLPSTPNWCYTEYPHLRVTEGLTGDRLPYLDGCQVPPRVECDEYPVLTMYTMRLAAWLSDSRAGFFVAIAAIMALAALAAALALLRTVGLRALYFAAAPTLFLYGYMNFDLLAVGLMTVGIVAFLRGRDIKAGLALGLGAAAKMIPGLIVAPLCFRRNGGGIVVTLKLAATAAITWLAFNVPFTMAAPRGWWEFFRFNSARPPDIDSLWFAGCHWILREPNCGHVAVVNLLSLGAFLGGVLLVWRMKQRRDPDAEPWTMGFAVLSLFLLTNKVASPQYSLFLLPWFALVLPNIRLFVGFELLDAAVFVTRYRGLAVPSLGTFELEIVLRALVIVACIIEYIRGDEAPIVGREVRQVVAGSVT